MPEAGLEPALPCGKGIQRLTRISVYEAYEESRVLVTIDKDFGELAIVRGQAHSGIVRLVAL